MSKTLSMPIVVDLGGPGSGHHGHKGVPGRRGGSSPGIGGSPGYGGLSNTVRSETWEDVAEGDYEPGYFESYKLRIPGNGDAIVKPEPEYPKAGIKKGWGTFPHAEREVAAYTLSQELGYEDLVPPTVLGMHKGQAASFQSWQKDVADGYDTDYSKLTSQDVGPMAILDFLTVNEDRHFGNFLQRKDGSLVAIDHGVAFKNNSQLNITPGSLYKYLSKHGGPTKYNLKKSERSKFKSLFGNKELLEDYGAKIGEKNAELVWEKLDKLSKATAVDQQM